jgi:hypothetical protein
MVINLFGFGITEQETGILLAPRCTNILPVLMIFTIQDKIIASAKPSTRCENGPNRQGEITWSVRTSTK